MQQQVSFESENKFIDKIIVNRYSALLGRMFYVTYNYCYLSIKLLCISAETLMNFSFGLSIQNFYKLGQISRYTSRVGIGVYPSIRVGYIP